MIKYVDAEELKKRLLKASLTGVNLNKGFEGIINMMPPADVRENVQGEWTCEISIWNGFTCDFFRCNMCGKIGLAKYKFCPYCGADMRGKNEPH